MQGQPSTRLDVGHDSHQLTSEGNSMADKSAASSGVAGTPVVGTGSVLLDLASLVKSRLGSENVGGDGSQGIRDTVSASSSQRRRISRQFYCHECITCLIVTMLAIITLGYLITREANLESLLKIVGLDVTRSPASYASGGWNLTTSTTSA